MLTDREREIDKVETEIVEAESDRQREREIEKIGRASCRERVSSPV